MIKKTFIPNWYQDKKNIIRDKKRKICIMIVLLVNIFFIGRILNISNKISSLEIKAPVENSNSSLQIPKQDISTIEKYKQINDFLLRSNLTYTNIVITNSSLEIDMEVSSYEAYIHVIRCIEDEYSIKKLIPFIKSEESEETGENFNFKVILGV